MAFLQLVEKQQRPLTSDWNFDEEDKKARTVVVILRYQKDVLQANRYPILAASYNGTPKDPAKMLNDSMNSWR